MKKTFMTLVALLTITTAMAQNSDNKERQARQQPTVEQMVEMMSRDLNLTDEQKTKLVELNKEYNQKLKAILNDEQYQKYQQRNAFRGHRGGPRPGGRQFGGPRPNGQQFAGPRPEAPSAE